MERDLNEREKAGVPDAVLLEDYTNEDVFLENLEKRFRENIIYVRSNFVFDASHCVKSRLPVLFVVKTFCKSLRVETISSTDVHRSGADLGESLQGTADLLGRRRPGLPEKILFRGATACVSPDDPWRSIFCEKS